MTGVRQKDMPSGAYLRSVLDYDPESGVLKWRARPPEAFAQGRAFAAYWNGRWAGKPALTAKTGGGYLHGKIDMEYHVTHRVIWKMMTDEEPDNVVHDNRDLADNRWKNLVRDVHRKQSPTQPVDE